MYTELFDLTAQVANGLWKTLLKNSNVTNAADYKDMFLSLFAATGQAVDALEKAHLKSRETNMNADNPDIKLINDNTELPEGFSEEIRPKLVLNKKIIGANIRALRTRYSMTIPELAKIMSIAPSYLGSIERGRRGTSLDKLCIVANFFNVSLDSLLSPDSYSTTESSN
jgi:DNA-binding transcriptional regulator YiaG